MNDSEYISKLHDICTRVGELEQVIYKGNGKPSLIVQIAELKHQITSVGENVDSKFAALYELLDNKFSHINSILEDFNKRIDGVEISADHVAEQELENKRQRSMNSTSIIVAVIACIGAVASNFITIFVK